MTIELTNHYIEASAVQDMDIVTFVEEYLGIKLLQYQKEYLKWLSNQDTKHTHWTACPPKGNNEKCLQKN